MKRILTPALLLVSVFLHAQKNIFLNTRKNSRTPIAYTQGIHFSPFALLGIDFTAMAGGEYRLHPKLGFVTEVGYVFASAYLTDVDNDTRASGFIIRPSIRFYVGERDNIYFQPQASYKLVTNKKFDWVGRECVNNVSAYQEQMEFKFRRNIWGLNVIIGRLVPLGKRQHSFLDFYIGAGLKYKKSYIVDEPGSCYTSPNSFALGEDPDNGFFPALPGGVKLVFVIQ